MASLFSMSYRLQRQTQSRSRLSSGWFLLIVPIGIGLWYSSMIFGPEARTLRPAITNRVVPRPVITEPIVPPSPLESALSPIVTAPKQTTHSPVVHRMRRFLPAPSLQVYAFEFKGTTTVDGKPGADVPITIRMNDGFKTKLFHGSTNSLGSYSIPVQFKASAMANIDWSLEGNLRGYRATSAEGHLIMLSDDSTIIQRPLEFTSL